MPRVFVSIGILAVLYFSMAHYSTAQAAIGTTIMAAAFLLTILGLSQS